MRHTRRREQNNGYEKKTLQRTEPLLHRARGVLLRQACCWNPYNVKRALLLGLLAALFAASAASAGNGKVLAVTFDADVNPATQKWLTERIEEGADYDAIVILLDTPGGLDDSMRKIVQSELLAKEPVVVYVWPPGARAASAGVWIGQAADVLAMAPNTNIGSSTPITGSGRTSAATSGAR